MDTRERHLRLLTETIEAVNSTLDLQEVMELVASKVAMALVADACFVYLYDERADELVLRATHGTPIDEMSRRPRMRPGEGITGSAAAARAAVMLESQAHLDPRFKNFPNLPEDEYESILAVPILTRDGTLEGALNVRTRKPRVFSDDEVELLLAIAAQVAQSIEHAKLYSEAQRRVHELEALARISEAVSDALYLEESLEAIVKTTMDALAAAGAALVLDDGQIAWPEGVASTLRDSPAAALARPSDRRARRGSRPAVHRSGPRVACVDRHSRCGRAGARPRGPAGRARSGDPPSRQEQPSDRRFAPASAGALRRRDRPARGARALGQPHPRDRSRSRAADGAP